ncbi:MAG: metal ABC transporter permease [Nitrospirae bacterium]|nr:metal ABC transporter permease [Nitrospirota bacterium]
MRAPQAMIELLQTGFGQRALWAGLAVSVVCGLVSVFVVLRRMSFIGAGISHAAFGGVAIGFLTGINPLLTAVIYSLAAAVGIDIVGRRSRVSADTAIGIFFASSMALGIVLIGLSRSYNMDLFGYLFGSILAITPEEAWMAGIMAAAVAGFILLFLKELFLAAYNEELAMVHGIPVRALNLLFLAALSIAIVVSIRMVGIVLVSALLVIPGATARLIANSPFSMAALSCLSAAISTIAGLYVSFTLDIAPGGAIVLAATLMFFVTMGTRALLDARK